MKLRVLIFLILPLVSYGQENIRETYLDALILAENYNKMKPGYDPAQINEQSRTILEKYGFLYNVPSTNLFLTGPFLFGLGVEIHLTAATIAKDRNGNYIVTAPKPVPTLLPLAPAEVESKQMFGASWQSAVINGTADFMAERFSAEIMYHGTKKMFKNLSDDQSKLLEVYFPKSIGYIKVFNGRKSFYASDLLFLKQLVLDDLNNLPNVYIAELDAGPVKDNILIGQKIYKTAKDGAAINDVLANLTLLGQENTLSDPDLKKIFHLLELFSAALKNAANATNEWKNPYDLAYNDKNPEVTSRYFYGLLYQQLQQEEMFKDKFKTANEFVQKTQGIASFVNQLTQSYKMAKKQDFTFENAEQLLSYISGISEAVEKFASNDFIRKGSGIEANALKDLNKYLHIIEPFLNKDYQRGIAVLLMEIPKGSLPENYYRNMLFLAELAQIQKSEDMKKLLESYALPIGSSSIKRDSEWNVTLNGYVGLTGGKEKAYGSLQNQARTNIGLTAPIGVSLTYNRKLTGFFSVLDIGSMVNVRLNNDTSFYDGLKFEQFLAPGFGLYYNFLDIPISVGIHYNYIPSLRTIKYTEGEAVVTDENVSVSRFNFSILFDIPFFTIYNKEHAEVIKPLQK